MMEIDSVTLWTAAGSIGTLAAIAGAIVGAIRKSDMTGYHERVTEVDSKVNALSNVVSEKAHKDEVRRIEARFEKDITDLRTDQKIGFSEVRNDIKDMRSDLMDALRAHEIGDRKRRHDDE
jgi:hypothetical protein